MDKGIFQSKTMWGFGLAALIAVAQIFGIGYSESAVANFAQVVTLLFGGYGLRDAAN